jgi:hypothetical protein
MLKKPEHLRIIIPIALGATVIFPFLPFLFNGEIIYWGTSTTQFLPWLNLAFESISQGNFPLWNSYNGMGAPFLANYQTALFYFPNWILWFFFKFWGIRGIAIGTTLSVLFHLYFGSIGMYTMLKYLKRSSISAYLGSVIWVFGGYAISRVSFFTMIWSFSWISWIVYALLLLMNASPKEKLKRIIFLSFLLSMQFFSGHAQTSYFTIIISFFLIIIPIYGNLIEKIRNIVLFLIAIFYSFLLSAIQLIPTAEYLLLSQRSQEVGFNYAVNFSFWPLRILSTMFGNFWGDPGLTRFFGGGVYWEDNLYIGVSPLLLIALIIIYYFKKKQFSEVEIKEKKFVFSLIILATLAFLFSLGRNFFLFPFFYKYIPTFNMFQAPSRFLLITNFCLAIISAYAFDYWKNTSHNPRKAGVLIVIGLALIFSFLSSLIFLNGIPAEINQSILIGSILIILFGILTILKSTNVFNKKELIIIVFVLISCTDIIFINFPYGNFIDIQYLETISKTNRNFKNDTVFLDRVSEDFLKFNRYFRFDRFQLLENLKVDPAFFLPNTNLIDPKYKMINNFDPIQPEKYANFLDWLNLLSEDEQFTMLRMVGTSILAQLDVNSSAGYKLQALEEKEIVQWYDCAVGLPTDDSLDWILYNESGNPDSRCIVVDKSELMNNSVSDMTSNLVILNYKQNNSNEISISYSSDKEGWLVIRQTWYPGWKAELDNITNVSVQEVDYMFQGLYVPAGAHDIVMKYKPLTFTIGFYISCINWIILLVFGIKIFAFMKKN